VRRVQILTGKESIVYRALWSATSLERVAEKTDISTSELRRIVRGFQDSGVAIEMDGMWLALAVPTSVDAWKDAELDTGSKATLVQMGETPNAA
jgi:hypothetical protein